jgi:1-acyl-sn-glycerol-3-phosphate acyltransferase
MCISVFIVGLALLVLLFVSFGDVITNAYIFSLYIYFRCNGNYNLMNPEAEFMSVQFLGIILRVIRLEVSVYNIYITNQFQTTVAQGGWGV